MIEFFIRTIEEVIRKTRSGIRRLNNEIRMKRAVHNF